MYIKNKQIVKLTAVERPLRSDGGTAAGFSQEGSSHPPGPNHFFLPQTERCSPALSPHQCSDCLFASWLGSTPHLCPDINEWLIGDMTANSRCSVAEPPGLETQRREIECLLRESELQAGESWWVSAQTRKSHFKRGFLGGAAGLLSPELWLPGSGVGSGGSGFFNGSAFPVSLS